MSNSNLPYFLSIFLGFVPFYCALAGWGLARPLRRNFVAGAAGIFLLLSFGNFTPVFALAYLLLPPLTVVRYPVKLLILVTFLLSILAGWGFDAYWRFWQWRGCCPRPLKSRRIGRSAGWEKTHSTLTRWRIFLLPCCAFNFPVSLGSALAELFWPTVWNRGRPGPGRDSMPSLYSPWANC